VTERTRIERRMDEFRGRVLEAASQLFETNGIEATKLDDICEAADVSKRTLCNHFPTKADMVQALSEERVNRIVALLDDARLQGRTTHDRLELFLTTFRRAKSRRSLAHRETIGAFILTAQGAPGSAESEVRLSSAIRELLEAGKRSELPPGCTAETFSEVVLGVLYSVTLEWVHRDRYDFAGHLKSASAFLLNSLRKP